jgi:hypothetical protein
MALAAEAVKLIVPTEGIARFDITFDACVGDNGARVDQKS